MIYQLIRRRLVRLAAPALLAVALALGGGAAAEAASVHVTGTVTDQHSTGVQNVTVTATDPGGTTVTYGPSFTGADGSYELDVDPGTYDFHFVAPNGSGLNPVVYSNFTVMTDQVLSVQMVPPTHVFSGTIRDGGGNPIAGLQMRLGNEHGGSLATTDANGAVTITVTAGVYNLSFNGDLSGTTTLPESMNLNSFENIDLTGGDVTRNLQLNTKLLTVTLKDSQGNPIAGASTLSESINSGLTPVTGATDPFKGRTSSNSFTAADGTVHQAVFVGLNYRPVCATLTSGRTVCAPAGFGPVSGDVAVDLVAPVTHTFSGVLRDGGGSPIANAQVRLLSEAGSNQALTDETGAFAVEVNAGIYSAGITYEGSSDTTVLPDSVNLNSLENIDLTTADVTHNLRLNTHVLTVTVKDKDGLPDPGVQVSSSSINSGQTPITGMTDPFRGRSGSTSTTMFDGVTLQAVLSGLTYNGLICAHFSSGQTSCTGAIGPITGDVSVELTEPNLHRLSGTIRDGGGNAIEGLQIRLTGSNGQSAVATTDSTGAYSMQIAAGVYSPSFTRFGSGTTTLPASINLGSVEDVDLTTADATRDFQLQTKVLQVSAKDGSGNPVTGVQVSATGHGQTPMTGSTTLFSGISSLGLTTGASGLAQEAVFEGFTYSTVCADFPTGERSCLADVGPITANVNLVFQIQPQVPAAPTGLSAVTPTKNAPTLTWNAVSTAVNYRVFRNGVQIGTTAMPNFVDSGVAVSGSYSYKVQAVNGGNVAGADSVSLVVVYDITKPTVGTLSWSSNPITRGSNTTLTVPVSDALSLVTGGEYFIGVDPGLGNGTAMTLSGSTITASFGASLAVGIYSVGVRSRDNAGNWSDVSTGLLTVLPAVPVITGGPQLIVIPKRPVVSWGAVTGATGYRVYRNGVVLPGTVATTSFTDNGATAAATYSYTVVALGAGGTQSAQSAAYVITVLPAGNTVSVTGSVLPVAPADVLPNFLAGQPGTFSFTATNQAGVIQPATFNFTYRAGAQRYTVNATSMQWVTLDPVAMTASVQGLANTRVGNGATVSRAFRMTISIGNPQHFKLEVFSGTTLTGTPQYHVDENNNGDVVNWQ